MIDASRAYDSYRSAGIASFGSADQCLSRERYQEWLTRRVEEYPDGQIIACLGEHFVGQLQTQVPYGLKTGYVNLLFVAPAWRRLGFGRRLHEYAQQYFRSWEADRVELHVATGNVAAINLYRSLGYRFATEDDRGQRSRKMRLQLKVPV